MGIRPKYKERVGSRRTGKRNGGVMKEGRHAVIVFFFAVEKHEPEGVHVDFVAFADVFNNSFAGDEFEEPVAGSM